MDVQIIKKDGTLEQFNSEKIIKAIKKSATRVMVDFTPEEEKTVVHYVKNWIKETGAPEIDVAHIHNMVEGALERINHSVATSYKEYRNYKKDFISITDKVYQYSKSIMYLGDKENSNTDSALVSTKRSLTYNKLSDELYKKFFLTTAEKQAMKDGAIYVHDRSARLLTFNCCLFDVGTVMNGGFEMGNMWYNEPTNIDKACDVLGDIIMNSASQQYGGWTFSEVDKVLGKYVEKTFHQYLIELESDALRITKADHVDYLELHKLAEEKTYIMLHDGIQGLEYKANSVASSRGDYPFLTFSFGLGRTPFEKMVSKAILEVRRNGQGKKGFKKPVLFPKLVFLYDEAIHADGKDMQDIKDLGILCSSKTMYPDWLSMNGDTHVAEMYRKYGEVISPMGE